MQHPSIYRLLIMVCFFFMTTFRMTADSWIDPTWKAMIADADVIAMVEYTTEGKFRAQAKPLVIYKGTLKEDFIWISGFSNRYGPIDTMTPGDRYIVFLYHNAPSERRLEYYKGQLEEQPELKPFYEAYKAGKAYYLPSPTSGDLKVVGQQVQYDLLQTSQYGDQSFYALKTFESFLKATQGKSSKFHKKILKHLKKAPNTKETAQFLRMLQLTGYSSYQPIFKTIADAQQPESCFALAKLLGPIKTSKSRDLLIPLLKHENSIVQGEVVRQLSDEAADFIGPILLSHLETAGEGGSYTSDLMDPVRNSLDGGKIEIIQALGKLQYKPAAKVLLPMLDTKDEDQFRLLIKVLMELGTTDYIPYINQHLRAPSYSLIFEICNLITDHNLEACKPALMDFITHHNRNEHPTYDYAISTHMGLGFFQDSQTTEFLLKDFEHMLTKNDTLNSSNFNKWTRSYIKTFTELKAENARPLIYDALFEWFGYNAAFAKHPELFKVKTHLENTLNTKIKTLLSEDEIEGIESIVWIENTADFTDSFVPSYRESVLIRLESVPLTSDGKNPIWDKMEAVKSKVSISLGIPLEQISVRSGSYVYSLNERFDTKIDWSPMSAFYDYAEGLPNSMDLKFLKALRNSGFAKSDFDKRQLKEAITAIENQLR